MSSSSLAPRFGPYIILDRLGDGGMAEIFLAKIQGYSGFEKQVALKRILPRYSQNPAFARMLIQEAKLAASLSHHNVVQVHDLGEIDGQVFIAMEYVRGRDLAQLLSSAFRRNERLPVPITLFIAAEFLAGLDYAHRLTNSDGDPLGLVHRDISPQNVLISYEGDVKLTDFGIARVVEQTPEGRLPGNLHGKFGYMSPEQVDNKMLDQRSDIFGAGVVVYEMLTGQRLFRGKTPRRTVAMIRACEIAPPSSINPEVPPSVDRILARALARNRDERYQGVGAFLGDISRAADTVLRRATRRDLAVYMRRHFGSALSRSARSAQRDATSRRKTKRPSVHERVPLGETLISHGVVDADRIEIALAQQRARGGRLGEILVASNVVTEADVARGLAAQANLPYVDDAVMETVGFDPILAARLPRAAAEDTFVFPLALDPETNGATLAVEDPFDARALLEVKIVLGVSDVSCVVATHSAIRDAIARRYPTAPEASETPLPAIESTSAIVQSPLVIIADADPTSAEELGKRLRAEDYDVEIAADGKSARSLFDKALPTVAVLDAALPGVDGFNLLLELRNRGGKTAVFLVSDRADGFLEAKALELGADGFMTKPLNVEVATSKIRREVQKQRAAQRDKAELGPAAGGVLGSLVDMPLVDIIQTLELGQKTAQVILQSDDGRRGELYVEKGEIKAAKVDELEGEDAFFVLSSQGTGAFRIQYRVPAIEPNIFSPNTALLLEALRRIDDTTAMDRRSSSPAPWAVASQATEAPPGNKPPAAAVARPDLVDDLDDFPGRASAAPDAVTQIEPAAQEQPMTGLPTQSPIAVASVSAPAPTPPPLPAPQPSPKRETPEPLIPHWYLFTPAPSPSRTPPPLHLPEIPRSNEAQLLGPSPTEPRAQPKTLARVVLKKRSEEETLSQDSGEAGEPPVVPLDSEDLPILPPQD